VTGDWAQPSAERHGSHRARRQALEAREAWALALGASRKEGLERLVEATQGDLLGRAVRGCPVLGKLAAHLGQGPALVLVRDALAGRVAFTPGVDALFERSVPQVLVLAQERPQPVGLSGVRVELVGDFAALHVDNWMPIQYMVDMASVLIESGFPG